MEPRTVFLILSEELGWGTLRQVLDTLPAARVVGEATDWDMAATTIPAVRPDIVLAAATLGGATIASRLRSLCIDHDLHACLAVFAKQLDIASLAELSDLDIAAYLLWDDVDRNTLASFLIALLAGRVIMSNPQIMRALVHARPLARPELHGAVVLTERERAVLRGLATGMTREEIATASCMSVRTVKRVVAELQERLEAPGPMALGMRVRDLGLTF